MYLIVRAMKVYDRRGIRLLVKYEFLGNREVSLLRATGEADRMAFNLEKGNGLCVLSLLPRPTLITT